MKGAHISVKISAFLFVSVALLLCFCKQLTDEDQQLLLFNYLQFTFNISSFYNPKPLVVDNSPNYNKHISRREVNKEEFAKTVPNEKTGIDLMSTSETTGPLVERFGVLDENGIMLNAFRVGDFSKEVMESLGNLSIKSDEDVEDDVGIGVEVGVYNFAQCSGNMTDNIPCFLDNVNERRCPEKRKGLNCLIPQPKDYKRPVQWPTSRDEVWYSNVLHTQLDDNKQSQNGISIAKDKIQFSGGDAQYIHGPDQYIDYLSKMVPSIAFGQRTRVVLDIGCGVASFGAHLMTRDALTLSIAPKIVHENEVQLALERGVPAMVAAFATQRLVYPSQAFDLIHCSGCGIDWTSDDGILLLELNRMLRAGGFFIYKHEVNSEEHRNVMVDLASRICWKLVKREGHVAVWRKPRNNICYLSRQESSQPPLCDANDDPDNVWNVDLTPCISRLPENSYEANMSTWPTRLYSPPDRLQTIRIEAYISRKELYKAESRYMDEMVENNVKYMRWKEMGSRNVLDMRAGFGGFAAALINQKVDCWVMNVVPVGAPNTLPVIFDRGLIGVMHDWCEPFDTYPRTYDLLHASGLFSVEQSRCDIASIMLEMDRILRPGGYAYIQDSVTVIYKLQEIGNAMGWQVLFQDMGEGPESSYKTLVCEKPLNGVKFALGKVHHRRRHRRRHEKDRS